MPDKYTPQFEPRVEDILQEYQDFAYMVSHDLNAPMRHVRQFTGLLLEDCAEGQFSADQRQYVEFLYRALDQVDVMQQALLEFSRLGTRIPAFDRVDLAQIIDDVRDRLGVDDGQRDISFVCDEMPVVWGHDKSIAHLFEHILDNALKFHPVVRDIRAISVFVEENDGRWHFSVQDNGIGIEAGRCEDALRMFKRLRPDDYDGLGTGLSLAHKIVQLHGGALRISPREGHVGAEVCFSLPAMGVS